MCNSEKNIEVTTMPVTGPKRSTQIGSIQPRKNSSSKTGPTSSTASNSASRFDAATVSWNCVADSGGGPGIQVTRPSTVTDTATAARPARPTTAGATACSWNTTRTGSRCRPFTASSTTGQARHRASSIRVVAVK